MAAPIVSATGQPAAVHRRWAGALLTLALAGCQGEVVVDPDAASPRTAAEDTLTISRIQGTGRQSPLAGQPVALRGVVSGNFVGGLGGFFLASLPEDADRDPDTSEGIFVEWPAESGPRPAVGDVLTINGRVTEIGREPASLTALTEADWQRIGHADVPITQMSTAPASAEAW
ncbi:MAG: hypothetical protein CVV17_05310, partial [Gammaproteobacteria bacterium HGW-Gammaproteobacteria-7]